MAFWACEMQRYRIRPFPDGSTAVFDKQRLEWSTMFPEATKASQFVGEQKWWAQQKKRVASDE